RPLRPPGGGDLHQLPAAQDRRGGGAAHPHRLGRRLQPAAARRRRAGLSPVRRPRLRPRSLAARLSAGGLCLAAAARLAFGGAGAVLLHRSLVADVDARLHGLAGGPPPGGDRGGDASAEDRPQPPPLPTDLRELSVDADGAVRWSVGQTEDDASGPDVSALDPAGLERAGDAPFTLPDSAGGADWRVVSSARPDGSYRLVAQSLAGVERTLERLVLIEAALGALLLAAQIGRAHV